MSEKNNSLWYKDGIIYQIHIKAYKDSNNDGMGDFGGLTEQLDYIESLGVNIIWLLPFYPSPLKDDGYDIQDYSQINPDYGTLEEFKIFLEEAHKRNIKVITELVLNHTSDQHEWFKRARKSPAGSNERNYYVWSDRTEKYKEARIIFSDYETSNWAWDPVAKSYYWHRFYSHQPDLNFENTEVREKLFNTVSYWLEMGVDGLRLDAVPYLYEREGTSCENLPETHEYLKKLSAYIQEKFENKMLLAEANQWPEDAVEYFGKGDECQMAFHFPLMPRMYMAIQMESRYPIIDILEQTPEIPDSCQWAMFLRNHDELTLEMVTDEERDYMYSVFAKDRKARINLGIRRRLAPLFENNRRKIELINFLLFSFPGTPIIYYGDELGMGDNYYLGDRHGVRTPMQWSSDRNAGFSKANPQTLYLPVIIDSEYHYETVNVEVQHRNTSSLLWWMRRIISVRKKYKAFGRGKITFLSPSNPKVLAFIRDYEDETILVIANLSRFSQVVELNLSDYSSYIPVELFSMNRFPEITNNSYMFTLNSHDYYWFELIKSETTEITEKIKNIPELQLNRADSIFENVNKERLEQNILPVYLKQTKIFHLQGKIDNIKLNSHGVFNDFPDSFCGVADVSYLDTVNESFFIPLKILYNEGQDIQESIIASVIHAGDEKSYLVNGFYDRDYRINFVQYLLRNNSIELKNGRILYLGETSTFGDEPEQGLIINESRNKITVNYGDNFILKLYFKLEEGDIPSVEIPKFIRKHSPEKLHPDYMGVIKIKSGNKNYFAGTITEYIKNEGTAENYFYGAAQQFFESILSSSEDILIDKYHHSIFNEPGAEILFLDQHLPFTSIYKTNCDMIGNLLGNIHNALTSEEENPAFVPDNFTPFYRRSIYQTVRSAAKSAFRIIKSGKFDSPGINEVLKDDISLYEERILDFARRIISLDVDGKKIRIIGNLILEHIIFTGREFYVTNFDGITDTSISDRRLKRFPLRDTASMLISFYDVIARASRSFVKDSRTTKLLEGASGILWSFSGSLFMNAYREKVRNTGIIPELENHYSSLQLIYLFEGVLRRLSNIPQNETDEYLNYMQLLSILIQLMEKESI